MKVRTPLDKTTLNVWALVLDRYPVRVLNRACLKLGLVEDPFPDLGKLVQTCEEIVRAKSGKVYRGNPREVNDSLLGDVASRLGLEVAR